MNEDVVTGGHKLVHSLVNKQSRPEMTVTLFDQKTVARSLDFQNLTTETQFAPDTLQSGRTLETTAKAISRSASLVLNSKVHSKNSHLRKLRSNAAYKAVAGLDTTSSRKTRASATSEVASGKRSPSFFARFAERISPAKSPPNVATKTSSLARTVLGFFHTKNTLNGKSLEPEPEPPIQQSQGQSRQDIPDQGEQASVPNTCDQEPEEERSGFPVERPEGPDPDNSADTGHLTDEAISRRPEPIDGVEETNEPTEVLDVDPRVEEDDSNGTTDVRAEGDYHVVCETVLDLPAGTVSQPNRLAERQGYLDYIQTPRGSILPSFEKSGRPIHSLADGIAGLSTNISGRHSQPHPIPTGAATTTTDARDQLTAEEVGQYPRSQQTEQRTARRGDQTNPLPNQNPIVTTNITGYHGTDITAIRSTTASTAAVENPSTTDTSTTHRPPPYSATTQPAYKSTQNFPGTTVQADSRRCCEPRSLTSSVSAQSQTSQQELDYESIKEALLDHFHGDENVDLYLQKFNKVKRKPGEKVVDYALRQQEIFKRSYPAGHSEKSFAVILMQKFIEELDSKLQAKVKNKEFKDFNELVAATRVYVLRLEALETDREKQEFIRSIDGSQDTSNAELKEIKKMIIDRKEFVNKAVVNIRNGDKPFGGKKTENEEIKDVLSELIKP
ncbi:hypothetical protein OUZ56_021569 [Daphnia magna]|uniref:Retrotransposon gag domain-containing protein n=1 Tax=Daphnia magna TaxID=35525 RepID=A0ABR0ATV9_9CRUS|nr:hypothetical protein OUZ56_021569 [Daphnia magna]